MIVNQEMYEEGSACFDPIPMQDQTLGDQEQGLSYPQQDAAAAAVAAANGAVAVAMELELQQQMGFEIDHNCYNPNNNMEAHLMQDPSLSNWETHHQEMNYNHYHQIQEMHNNNTNRYPQSFMNTDSCSLTETDPYPPTQDFLNLFHTPRCLSSLLPNSSISFTNPTQKLGFLGDFATADTALGSSVLYDPMFHLNLPPQPPLFREVFDQSLPQKYNFPGTRTGSLSGGVEEIERSGELDNGVLEFSRGMNCLAKGREGKDTKHFVTERQRRVHLNDKYNALKELVPNPTKVYSMFLCVKV